MTDREKAIVMAHTGICMLTGDKFQIFHKYVEDIMGRPVWTHDIGFLENEIKEKSKDDFIALCADEDGSEKLNRWIPVSERLPEEDGQYLITVKYKPEAGYEDIYAEHGEWRDGRWDMFCFGHCGEVEDIVAWMPLPEPYKAESEDKE